MWVTLVFGEFVCYFWLFWHGLHAAWPILHAMRRPNGRSYIGVGGSAYDCALDAQNRIVFTSSDGNLYIVE